MEGIMARNELAFSEEAAKLVTKALEHYIAKGPQIGEEAELAEELTTAFKSMYED